MFPFFLERYAQNPSLHISDELRSMIVQAGSIFDREGYARTNSYALRDAFVHDLLLTKQEEAAQPRSAANGLFGYDLAKPVGADFGSLSSYNGFMGHKFGLMQQIFWGYLGKADRPDDYYVVGQKIDDGHMDTLQLAFPAFVSMRDFVSTIGDKSIEDYFDELPRDTKPFYSQAAQRILAC